ncbi:hypothetical protein SS33_10730 [Enterobacter kobei]|nr:hypothetical protein SS33_10730 [Enterobacter kobei]
MKGNPAVFQYAANVVQPPFLIHTHRQKENMKDLINIYLLMKHRAYARENINAFSLDMISVQICSYYE